MDMLNNERGASAIEFAFVVGLLVLILGGIIEFGFLMYDKAVITNASREAARVGIVYHQPGVAYSWDDIMNEMNGIANNYCSTHLVSLGYKGDKPAPTVDIKGNCFTVGSKLEVDVSYPYTFLFLPNFAKDLPPKITLTAATVMNCENQIDITSVPTVGN